MKKAQIVVLALAALLLHARNAAADLEIVTSVPTLAAIADEIGGSHVSVTSLSLHTQDPHFVDAKPSLALKLNKADMLLAIGLSLEAGWLPTLQEGSRNARIQSGGDGYLEVSKFARLLDVPSKADRSDGDVHPGGSPHFLFDPRQIAHVATGVAGRMGELDEDNRDAYKDNLKKFLKKLHKKRLALEKKMKAHKGEKTVAYHKSWVYVAEWLGLTEVAFIEPKPGIPPNPGHVAKVVAKAKKAGVKVVMQESFYPDETSKKVAELVGAQLVLLPGGVDFQGGESITTHLDKLINALDSGFE